MDDLFSCNHVYRRSDTHIETEVIIILLSTFCGEVKKKLSIYKKKLLYYLKTFKNNVIWKCRQFSWQISSCIRSVCISISYQDLQELLWHYWNANNLIALKSAYKWSYLAQYSISSSSTLLPFSFSAVHKKRT